MSDLDERLQHLLQAPIGDVDPGSVMDDVRRRKSRRRVVGHVRAVCLVLVVIAGVGLGSVGLLRVFGAAEGQRQGVPGGSGTLPGGRIFFTQQIGPEDEQLSILFSVNTDGTDFRQVSPPGEYQGPVIHYGASLSPDGSRLVYVSSDGIGGRTIVLAEPDGRVLEEFPIDVSTPPVWSPDGSLLAFSGGGKITADNGINLITLDPDSGEIAQRTFGGEQWDGMVWSADGRSLVAIHDHRPDGASIERVFLGPKAKREVLWEVETPEGPEDVVQMPVIASGTISPDGTRVLHQDDRTQETTFSVTDLASGVTTPVALQPEGGRPAAQKLWASGWSPDGQSIVLNGYDQANGIWIASQDGSNLHRVYGPIRSPMNGVGVYPTWEAATTPSD